MTLYQRIECLCLAALILWAGPAYAQTPTLPQGDFAGMDKGDVAVVLEVIDPETVKLGNGATINLTGLYYPDYGPEQQGPLAVTALKILKDMLEDQDVQIYRTKNKDLGRTNRMGHQLAHLVRVKDGAWVQGTMIELGLAQMRTTNANPDMAAAMLKLEATARANKAGLWEEPGIIRTPETVGQYEGSFQIVEGQVLSAAMQKNRIYLNFGGNWRDDFTVSIAPENKRAFSRGGINPLEWNGKTVRVRGWVEEYNGPMIEIDHPEAIEILSPTGEASLPVPDTKIPLSTLPLAR